MLDQSIALHSSILWNNFEAEWQKWYNCDRMLQEVEQHRFGRREYAGRTIGGNVADNPFSRALHCMAAKRGFESQTALGRALGKKHIIVVSRWLRGESVPSPKEFGNIIKTLKPTDNELDVLVEPYAQLILEGRGIKGGLPEKRVGKTTGGIVTRMQNNTDRVTFNGAQAGSIFGVSRERIRQLRRRLELPLLMTEEDLAAIEAKLEKTKIFRRRLRQTRIRNR